ncbi:MAG: tetraacyldisaccharide 4'-kinase [Alphaproteobacteria bacterium]|nr:tetraacyldisaccharide 4'-kinase [Alphaproteobacteria bacterium]
MSFKNLNLSQFWQQKSIFNYLLLPLSGLWWVSSQFRKFKPYYESKLFVICLGNLNLGGSGKTPTAILLSKNLQEYVNQRGLKIAFLSKGYGGSLETAWVSPKHSPKEVGDEPILLSQYLPTLIHKNMVAGLKILEEEGFNIVITDDGFQNPTFKKDFNMVVVNGDYGFGNSLIFPSGPLRESVNSGLSRANIVLLLESQNSYIQELANKYQLEVIHGEYIPEANIIKKEDDFLAFCGIGMPFKFKKTLEKNNIKVLDFVSFSDHHNYTNTEIEDLINKAEEQNLKLITTQKDYVKIPLQYVEKILSFNIELQLPNSEILLNKIISCYEKKEKKIV